MKEILLREIRPFATVSLMIFIMIALTLFTNDKLEFIVWIATGYLMGIIWYLLVIYKTLRSSNTTKVREGQKEMVTGMVLRLLLLGVLLTVAIQISFDAFICVFVGFMVIYLVVLLLLMKVSYKQ